MSTSAQSYAQRREELIARLDRDRAAVAGAYTALQRQMRVAETVVGAARTAKKHRGLAVALALAAIVAPFTARTWLKRAAWLIPLAIQGIRMARRTRDRDDEPGVVPVPAAGGH